MQKIKLELKDKPLEPLMKKKTLLITPKKIILFVFVLFLLFVGFYFWKEICYLIKPPSLEVTQPPADITIGQNSIEIIGKTNPFVYLTIEGEEVYIDKEGNFKKEIDLSNGLNTVEVEAKNRFGKTITVIRRIIYTVGE